MSRRCLYTIITPLPPAISRATAVETLHSHSEMIELNPLVIKHTKAKAPPNVPTDERHCVWYELTDRITYLPGLKGLVRYKGCFHDLPRGVQTHVYAPAGLEIKEKWSIGGNEPGEEREVVEIGLAGLGVPRDGLYLREDVDMRCNFFLSSFVKRTLRKAHEVLVQRLVIKAGLEEGKRARLGYGGRGISALPPPPSSNCGSSIRSPTSYSLRDLSMSNPRDTPMGFREPLASYRDGNMLGRENSVRSGYTVPEVSSPTMAYHEISGGWIAELPVTEPLDPHAWTQKKLGMLEPHPLDHPSNAYGIAPTVPIELEALEKVRRNSAEA